MVNKKSQLNQNEETNKLVYMMRSVPHDWNRTSFLILRVSLSLCVYCRNFFSSSAAAALHICCGSSHTIHTQPSSGWVSQNAAYFSNKLLQDIKNVLCCQPTNKMRSIDVRNKLIHLKLSSNEVDTLCVYDSKRTQCTLFTVTNSAFIRLMWKKICVTQFIHGKTDFWSAESKPQDERMMKREEKRKSNKRKTNKIRKKSVEKKSIMKNVCLIVINV